ncbi:MAG: hypothetical protein WC211_01270 [Dehalococcoidia bacterium]
MTELSYGWDSTAVGDGNAYTEAQVAALFKAMFGGAGVFRGYLNELAPTVSGTNVLVNTGAAMSVSGHPYVNDASKSTAITTPSIGTTGHRLLLREDTSAQTVRIYDLASADGTATIPAATATDKTIATFTITTLGAITLTDARDFATGVFPNLFDVWRYQFRGAQGAAAFTGRKLLGLFTGSQITPALDGVTSSRANFGLGFTLASNSASPSIALTAYSAGVDPYVVVTSGGALGVSFGAADNGGAATLRVVTAPVKNPRHLFRWIPGASNANLTMTMAGFFQVADNNTPSATTNGAYLRANTTGNLFFVTRQGGAETTTDLGARPTSLTTYEIWTDDGGVTWYCRNNTTGAIVATHTGNVPTAATGVGYGFYGASGSGSLVLFSVGYAQVDAEFTP